MVAARTDRVQLGTCVTCPLFHYQPGLVAQMAATADRLSGGRMLLGLGTGEALNESSLGFFLPGLRLAPCPDGGGTRDPPAAAAGREADVPGELLHDRNRAAVLAAPAPG